jgi:dipeptidyl aminopeptidase/acylaminoacyl peptidase
MNSMNHKKHTGRPPGLFRLGFFILLNALLFFSAWLLHQFGGQIYPLYLALGLGAVFFINEFIFSAGVRGRYFYLAAAGIYGFLFFILWSQISDHHDAFTGKILLAAALLAWTGLLLVFYRRWPFPLFRIALVVTLLLLALDLYWLLLHSSLPVSPLIRGQGMPLQPHVISWSDDGQSLFINQKDESTVEGRLHQLNLDPISWWQIGFEGIVTQARMSPDGGALATVHEDSQRKNVLTLLSPETSVRQEVFSSTRSLYFPFRHTQNPWSADGRWLLFSDTAYGQSTLWAYDRSWNTTRKIAEGQGRVHQAFWFNNEHVALPGGQPTTASGRPLIQKVDILSASTGQVLESIPLEEDYSSLYAVTEHNLVMLKKSNDPRTYMTDLKLTDIRPLPVEDLSYLQVATSGDGRWLALPENFQEETATAGSNRKYGCRLRIYDRDSGQSQVIFNSLLGRISSAAWSPSGNWIAFSLRANGWLANGAKLVMVSPDGRRKYTPAPQSPNSVVDFYAALGRNHLLWRPGRDHLLFWTEEPEHPGQGFYRLVLCP